MKKITVIAVILLFAGISFAQVVTKETKEKIKKVENGLIEFKFGPPDNTHDKKTYTLTERMAFYKVPGVSVAVIDNYKIVWAKGYGTINASTGIPVSTASYFEAASTTKMLVAAIVLHYVEKGILEVDADVNKYLKRWKIAENEFTKDKKVTLRLLLTHQSGLPSSNFPYEDGRIPSIVQVLKGELPAQNKPAVVEAVPGSKWNYSNIGYVVIQLILEDLTDRSFQEIVKEIIFNPLKMKNSTMVYPLKKEEQKKEALPHDKEGKVGQTSMHPTALAQGGLMTTPLDLAAFTVELMRAYNGVSNKIISKEMVQMMLHPEVDLDPAIFGVPLKEGLGVFIFNGEKTFSFGHPGDNYPGSTCWLMGAPSAGKGIVIMTNGANGLPVAMEIFNAVKKEYGWPAGL